MAESAYDSVKANEDKKAGAEKAKLEAFLLKINLDARIAIRNGDTLEKFIADEVKNNPTTDYKIMTKYDADAYNAE